MTVVHHSRTAGDVEGSRWLPLDDLLRTSDIVSLHVPLTPATRHLIGERELRLMRPTATLVNAARGAVLDEDAIARALREGWIGSAGLDVQQFEPNPDRDALLLSLPNCVVLPHIGSATLAAREAMIRMATDNVIAFLDGGPLRTPVGAVQRDRAARQQDRHRGASHEPPHRPRHRQRPGHRSRHRRGPRRGRARDRGCRRPDACPGLPGSRRDR